MPFDPETGEPIDDQSGDEGAQGDDNRNIRRLREQAKAGEEATARADAAERKLAVIESGIDVNTPAGKLFLKAFDGDPTDAEALKAAAKEYEVPFIGEAGTTSTGDGEGGEGQTGDGDAGDGATGENGTGERSALANGAPADTGVSPDPNVTALEAAKAVVDGGGTEEDGFEAYMRSKASAAIAGDKRVLYDPSAE